MASSESEGETYEVGHILDKRTRGRVVEYKIRWKNFGTVEDSWEPKRNLKKSVALIEAYEKRLKTPGRHVEETEESSVVKTSSQQGRSVSQRTVTTKVETSARAGGRQMEKMSTTYRSGTQSEASSPESSPILGRRLKQMTQELKDHPGSRTVTTTTRTTRSSGGGGIVHSRGGGIGGGLYALLRQEMPIVVLLACMLFIAATFVFAPK